MISIRNTFLEFTETPSRINEAGLAHRLRSKSFPCRESLDQPESFGIYATIEQSTEKPPLDQPVIRPICDLGTERAVYNIFDTSLSGHSPSTDSLIDPMKGVEDRRYDHDHDFSDCNSEITTAMGSSGERKRGQEHFRKVFIGGLNRTTGSKVLRLYFSRFGAVKDCGVVRDYNGVSRRFGYCEFWSLVAVSRLFCVQHHEIGGKIVVIRSYYMRE